MLHQFVYTEVMSALIDEVSSPVSDIHFHFIIHIFSGFQRIDTYVHDDVETQQQYWSTYCFDGRTHRHIVLIMGEGCFI